MAVLKVPVKSKAGTVELDTDAVPPEVWAAIVLEGCKAFVNKGMAKVTKNSYPKEDELKAKLMEVAQANVEAILAGKIKLPGVKVDKVTGAEKTEAMRLARNAIKDTIKSKGHKISHYDASEITAAAKALLASDDGEELIAQARAEIAKRAEIASRSASKVNVADIKVNPKKVADAEAKRKPKTDKVPLSALQAGKVKPRPGQPQARPH